MNFWQRLRYNAPLSTMLMLMSFMSDVISEVKYYVPQQAYLHLDPVIDVIKQSWVMNFIIFSLITIVFSALLRSEKYYKSEFNAASPISIFFVIAIIVTFQLFF